MKIFSFTATLIVIGFVLFPRLTILGLIAWGVAHYIYNFNWIN